MKTRKPALGAKSCARLKSLVLLALCCLVRPAWSQEAGSPDDSAAKGEDPAHQAQSLYQSALKSFKSGDLDEAIRLLNRAYRLVPAAELLYNLGQAYRLKGDCVSAIAFYRQYIDTKPEGLLLQRALDRKAEMEKCVSSAAPEEPGGASVATPARVETLETPKAQTTLVFDPVSPQPQAAKPSQLLTESATGQPPAQRWRMGPAALTLAIASAALASASGYFTWRAYRSQEEMSGLFERGGRWDSAAAANQREGILSERLALGCGISALVSSGLATWLWYRGR